MLGRFLKKNYTNVNLKILRKNNGIAMVMFVILLPLILGFCGIAIDAGLLAYNYSVLRNSIRYAAYSGGSESDKAPMPRKGYEILDLGKSRQVAEAIFRKNVGNEPGIKVVTKVTPKKITITGSMNVELYFMKIIGGPSSVPISTNYIVNVN